MLQPIEFDGMKFGPVEIEANRQVVIQLRDTALNLGKMEWAVALSHTIVILATVKERMEAESDAK